MEKIVEYLIYQMRYCDPIINIIKINIMKIKTVVRNKAKIII